MPLRLPARRSSWGPPAAAPTCAPSTRWCTRGRRGCRRPGCHQTRMTSSAAGCRCVCVGRGGGLGWRADVWAVCPPHPPAAQPRLHLRLLQVYEFRVGSRAMWALQQLQRQLQGAGEVAVLTGPVRPNRDPRFGGPGACRGRLPTAVCCILGWLPVAGAPLRLPPDTGCPPPVAPADAWQLESNKWSVLGLEEARAAFLQPFSCQLQVVHPTRADLQPRQLAAAVAKALEEAEVRRGRGVWGVGRVWRVGWRWAARGNRWPCAAALCRCHGGLPWTPKIGARHLCAAVPNLLLACWP
jgi:hypothetical protein